MEKLFAIFMNKSSDYFDFSNLKEVKKGFNAEEDAERFLSKQKTFPDSSECKGTFLILPYYIK